MSGSVVMMNVEGRADGLSKDTAPPGIYAKRAHICDNDGLSDPVEDLYEVLMKNNGQWFYLAEEGAGAWVECHESYDPFSNNGLAFFRITGPGLPTMQVWRIL